MIEIATTKDSIKVLFEFSSCFVLLAFRYSRATDDNIARVAAAFGLYFAAVQSFPPTSVLGLVRHGPNRGHERVH